MAHDAGMVDPAGACAPPPGRDPVDAALDRVLGPEGVRAVVQPAVRAADGLIVGYEALARMDGEAARVPPAGARTSLLGIDPTVPPGPAGWLALADGRGRRAELEIACLTAAARLGPVPGDAFLFVNLSPSLLADPDALELLDALPDRLVVELTEQEAVDDYGVLRRRLRPWLSRGVRVAIDDTGAGYSSLRHVIELTPDFLKLDRELVRNLDRDGNRRALVSSVVAFAREVGTSVIAEGVETPDELEALRDAEVDLVQGYLLARPSRPWPEVVHPSLPGHPRPTRIGGGGPGSGTDRGEDADEHRLVGALARAVDGPTAAAAVVEHLFRRRSLLPSVYLERHGELRCVAQRGLWQVLDGFRGPCGITGRAWRDGTVVSVPEVRADPRYLEAVPGVVSELCVPLPVHGVCRGVLNVESLTALSDDVHLEVERCAGLLATRLEALGVHEHGTAWDRLAAATIAVSGVAPDPAAPSRLVEALLDASGLDSAALVAEGHPRLLAAAGPLTAGFEDLDGDDLDALAALVDQIRSCYTGGEAQGREYVGVDALRAGGARAVVVLPLWAHHGRVGTAVLAHSRPVRLQTDDIRPLEVLADHVASVLAAGMAGRPGDETECQAAVAAARARHPSAGGHDDSGSGSSGTARPTLTLVTTLGPRSVPELPVEVKADDGGAGSDPGPEDGDRQEGTPDEADQRAGVGLFLERRRRRRTSAPGA